jgi:hypothetical protein
MGSARTWLWIGIGSVLFFGVLIGAAYLFLRPGNLGPDPDSHFLEVKDGFTGPLGPYQSLMCDKIDIGRNYQRPVLRSDWGNPDKDFSRLATSYYHRNGPVGVVLERFNWFHGPANTYHADARLPASLLALGAGDCVIGGPIPGGMLVGVWSEPPLAVLGMEVGTPASYGRPFQRLDFFDRSQRLKEIVLPDEGKPRLFLFLHDAQQRGCDVHVFIGDVRQTLAHQSAERFYHVLIVETSRAPGQQVAMELLTKEAMVLFFEKLAERGILCIHTSHRKVDMVPVVADVAASLAFASRRGHDQARDGHERGHYSSEWVMVARRPEYLEPLQTPPGYDDLGSGPFWTHTAATGTHVWTDAGPNDLSAITRRR